jgi:hypothetical protein
VNIAKLPELLARHAEDLGPPYFSQSFDPRI